MVTTSGSLVLRLFCYRTKAWLRCVRRSEGAGRPRKVPDLVLPAVLVLLVTAVGRRHRQRRPLALARADVGWLSAAAPKSTWDPPALCLPPTTCAALSASSL